MWLVVETGERIEPVTFSVGGTQWARLPLFIHTPGSGPAPNCRLWILKVPLIIDLRSDCALGSRIRIPTAEMTMMYLYAPIDRASMIHGPIDGEILPVDDRREGQ